MISIFKLPFNFDSQLLKKDLALFAPAEWVPHFNVHYYEGDWSGIALRAPQNAGDKLFPAPSAAYADTEMLARCSYIPEVLSSFQCKLESARFLRLTPGSNIREHRDYQLSFDDGFARVHIPVQTNAAVEFFLNGESVEMKEGEAWYLNFNLKHRVYNGGADDRVHLVVDCVVNDWLREIFPAGN